MRGDMSLIVVLYLAIFTPAFAMYSEQPAKESTTDLRSQIVLFSVESTNDHKTYLLERTAGDNYFLRMRLKNEEIIRKIAGRDATRLDRDFANRFLRCQYEIPDKEGVCEVTLRLTMKGETQDICAKDDKKAQAIMSFTDELAKRF
jgi:hypothetical protein